MITLSVWLFGAYLILAAGVGAALLAFYAYFTTRTPKESEGWDYDE